ncbi:hypothetical protein C4D60_Mb00t03040 [Musa balbisiana]|uniref:Uncharacterized protein n=1 Tax=Musa balbisiana TaxID=52838 RepID=A0A4S8I2G2_MUSBA|nr:hypothetical protein C4D60_Mb00t03040 [Musa balbisiana]
MQPVDIEPHRTIKKPSGPNVGSATTRRAWPRASGGSASASASASCSARPGGQMDTASMPTRPSVRQVPSSCSARLRPSLSHTRFHVGAVVAGNPVWVRSGSHASSAVLLRSPPWGPPPSCIRVWLRHEQGATTPVH